MTEFLLTGHPKNLSDDWWCYSWHAKTDQSYSAAETKTLVVIQITPAAHRLVIHRSDIRILEEHLRSNWSSKVSPGRQNERSKCVKYSLRIFNKLCFFFITRRRPESNHSLFFVSIRQEPILEASKAWPVEDIRDSHSLLWKGRSCALIIFIFQRIWCVPYYLCCLLEKQLI